MQTMVKSKIKNQLRDLHFSLTFSNFVFFPSNLSYLLSTKFFFHIHSKKCDANNGEIKNQKSVAGPAFLAYFFQFCVFPIQSLLPVKHQIFFSHPLKKMRCKQW